MVNQLLQICNTAQYCHDISVPFTCRSKSRQWLGVMSLVTPLLFLKCPKEKGFTSSRRKERNATAEHLTLLTFTILLYLLQFEVLSYMTEQ